MGTAMWLRLHDQGIDPVVFDVRPEATASLARLGAAVAPDAAALATDVDIVLLSLPTSSEVEDVAIGPGGLVEGAGSTTLVVDLTSGLPSASRRIAAALSARSLRYIDAGVSGGVDGARAGRLKVMVGGEADDVAKGRCVLDELASRVWHCGAVGSGHTVKTLLNQANQTKLMIELEALLVAARSGIDPLLAADVLDLAVERSGSSAPMVASRSASPSPWFARISTSPCAWPPKRASPFPWPPPPNRPPDWPWRQPPPGPTSSTRWPCGSAWPVWSSARTQRRAPVRERLFLHRRQ